MILRSKFVEHVPWPGNDSARTNLMVLGTAVSEVSPVSEHFQYSKAFSLSPTSSVSITKPVSSFSSLKNMCSKTETLKITPKNKQQWVSIAQDYLK